MDVDSQMIDSFYDEMLSGDGTTVLQKGSLVPESHVLPLSSARKFLI